MMNCKRAKLSIALAVGNDLDDAAAGELQQHLAGCTSCRMHRRELESSLGALQTPPDSELFAAQDSVWPTVLGRLPSRREQRFNGWIPAAALAAAALMMISIINEPPQHGAADGEPYAGPTVRVPDQLQFRRWRSFRPARQVPAVSFEAIPFESDAGGPGIEFLDPETGRFLPPYNR